MRVQAERSLEHNQEPYICFVDFEKTFDRIPCEKMLEELKMIVYWKDRRLIAALYMNQEVTVKADGESEPGHAGRRVRQGCPLLPLLFNIYAEAMVKETLNSVGGCINVGGYPIQTVRFADADNQAIVTITEEGLQCMTDKLVEVVERFWMIIKLYAKKTH